MADTHSNAGAIWALGVTQIIGYGTLYYSFSILAPGIAGDLNVAVEWIYGCISLALLAGGLISPWAGGLADRIGADKVMSIGSIAAAAAATKQIDQLNRLGLMVCMAVSLTFLVA